MRYVLVGGAALAIAGAACWRISEVVRTGAHAMQVVSEAKRHDVESNLRRGKWQSRSGLSNGVAWQFADGGRVFVYDGGDIDESFRWRVISKNENEQKIRIKFWNPDEFDYREWEFRFASDGDPAQVSSFIFKSAGLTNSEEYLRYPVD
jgi:hypothetical protein